MTETLENFSESLKHFGVLDYAVFLFMLAVCSCIGLFFGFKDHMKHKANKSKSRRGSNSDTLDYLLGGKNVQVFPGKNYESSNFAIQNYMFSNILVAMSLVASYVSGITLLGTSTEIYIYGIQYAYISAAPIVMGVFMHYIIIPVFYDLKVVSMFEVRRY